MWVPSNLCVPSTVVFQVSFVYRCFTPLFSWFFSTIFEGLLSHWLWAIVFLSSLDPPKTCVLSSRDTRGAVILLSFVVHGAYFLVLRTAPHLTLTKNTDLILTGPPPGSPPDRFGSLIREKDTDSPRGPPLPSYPLGLFWSLRVRVCVTR